VTISRRSFVLASIASAGVPLAIGHSIAAQPAIPSNAEEALFVRAVDGEKIKVRIGAKIEEVRFIGVDAPEVKVDNNTTECHAMESTALLTSILADQTVYLESDVEDKDGKDRLWRYAWVVADGVPTLLNEYVLAQGAAILKDETKNTKYQARLEEAQQTAQSAKIGLWGACESGHQSIPRHGSEEAPGVFGEELVGESVGVTLSDPFVTYDYNFSTPKGGYKFLIFNASIVNYGDDKKQYASGRFQAKDLDTGADHKETFVLLDQPLGSGNLSTGSYVYGQVALEVQETATNLAVKYQVSSFGDISLYWLLQL